MLPAAWCVQSTLPRSRPPLLPSAVTCQCVPGRQRCRVYNARSQAAPAHPTPITSPESIQMAAPVPRGEVTDYPSARICDMVWTGPAEDSSDLNNHDSPPPP